MHHVWHRFEAGVHRVQRVPATETQGRVHTSTATVAIMPEVDEVEGRATHGALPHRAPPTRRTADLAHPAWHRYAPCLRATFELPQTLGIIGGRPRSSHYFLGVASDNLLYLDPHLVQPALRCSAPDASSCHYNRTSSVPTLPLLDIDPSLALGFLCPTAASFDDLCSRCASIFAKGNHTPSPQYSQ